MEFKLFFRSILRKVGVFSIGVITFIAFYILRDVYCDFGIDKKNEVKYYFNNISDFSVKKLEQTKVDYNTFIFGSSRSIPLYACYIKNKIFQNDSAIHPFHFANWGERIGGICKKIEYLDEKGFKLNNLFILLDNNIVFLENGAVKLDESRIISNKSWLQSTSNHFLYFFYYSGDNLPKNLHVLFGTENPIDRMFVDKYTNDLNHICPKTNNFDQLFITPQHIKNQRPELPKRLGFEVEQPNRINKIILGYLARIKKILVKQKSNYAIIYSPMYNQRVFGKKDDLILHQIFQHHIVDFSGVNSLTNSIDEYADKTHYFPSIAKRMIDSISNTSLFPRK